MTKGYLDCKYLADRYNKGVAKVNTYMSSHHRYTQVKTLSDAMPDYLELVQNIAATAKTVLLIMS